MTKQEAIKKIKYRIYTATSIAGNGKDGNVFEDLEMAIEALEKQILRKPDFAADGYADGALVYDTWLCPKCERAYEVEYDKYDYCPRCGQRIDWSEENDQEENHRSI